jgi:hypothetical protein
LPFMEYRRIKVGDYKIPVNGDWIVYPMSRA